MRNLETVEATAQQLKILAEISPGAMVIRGAAGSGKTTTAILRLRSLLNFFQSRKVREGSAEPVRALVLTYNSTLRGYINDLVRSQVVTPKGLELEVNTFGGWAKDRLRVGDVLGDAEAESTLRQFGGEVPLEAQFLATEAQYVMGRFLPADLPVYMTAKRLGRGPVPRVESSVKRQILDSVIAPYNAWKRKHKLVDWNDLAIALAGRKVGPVYDIIIADECQDFSANQLRAMNNHLKADHSLTLIIDSIQRIYCRGFTWSEVGINRPATRLLEINYRNTIEIARFAGPLLRDVPVDDDGTLPDFTKTERRGRKPVVLSGRFAGQMTWAVRYIQEKVDLETESVAFLHPQGGNWFRHVRQELETAGLPYVELSRKREWPTGDENIGLSTLYSAKGLEFDHVFILGLAGETLRFIDGDEDRETMLRRLVAMGVGRARTFVCLGYSSQDPPGIVDYLEDGTFNRVDV